MRGSITASRGGIVRRTNQSDAGALVIDVRPVSLSPGEQHIGVQTITPRHLCNGCTGRKALRDDPLLRISRPSVAGARRHPRFGRALSRSICRIDSKSESAQLD
jgi:hypothetical protein